MKSRRVGERAVCKRQVSTAGAMLVALGAILCWLGISTADGATFNIPSSCSVADVNAFFQNFQHSNDPVDIVNLPNDHFYSVGFGQPGFVIPDGVNNIVWNWNGSYLDGPGKDNREPGVVIGGSENLVVNNPHVIDFQAFMRIGGADPYGTPYENVRINGAYADTSRGLGHTNVYASEIVTGPSIFLSHSFIKADIIGVDYNSLNAQTNEYTKYVRQDHITAVIGGGLYARLPKGSNGTSIDDLLLGSGDDDLHNIALIGSYLIQPEEGSSATWIGTPLNIAQKDSPNPYINPARNCFVTDDMKFVLGTYVPQWDSPLNLGGGEYIGAYPPVPEPATLGLLTFGSLAAAIRRKRREG